MQKMIEAKEHNLAEVFKDTFLFQIPDYQRPYAWTTEETGELLDDLIQAMGDGDRMEPTPAYFLGSIVLIKEQHRSPSEVVDGQQRLMTLTILLCALRELSNSTEEKQHLDVYIREHGNIFSGAPACYRLSPRPRDRDFFRANIQDSEQMSAFVLRDPVGLSDPQENMLLNCRLVYQKLEAMTPESRRRLATFLIQQCYLVVVTAADHESAYRIFSVMNDRGLDLSPTDILKSNIIGKIPEERRDRYTLIWEDIEESLGRDRFRDLFSHIRMIYTKTKARASLSQEFREGVLKQVDGPEFIENVLAPYANTYQDISDATFESTHQAEWINAYLEHLTRLDNYDWIPPAILFFNRHRNNPAQIARFVQDLERLAYGLFLLRANINDRIYRYAQLISAIEQDADLFAQDSPLQLTDQECKAVLQGLDGPIYLQTRVRLPLLLRLDSLMSDAGARYDHKVISVEHVLPRQPAQGSEWLDSFPDPEIRDTWTHRLANLVLLSRQKNTQAQNYDFARKKEEYFKKRGIAHFALTSQVLSETEWDPDVLQRRQTDLIDRLAREWRLR